MGFGRFSELLSDITTKSLLNVACEPYKYPTSHYFFSPDENQLSKFPSYSKKHLGFKRVSETIAHVRSFQSVACGGFRAQRWCLKCPWMIIEEIKFTLCIAMDSLGYLRALVLSVFMQRLPQIKNLENSIN